LPLVDPRFPSIRQRYDVMLTPHRHAGWWRECVLGPVEAVEYRLQEQKTGRAVARAVVWDMGTFAPLWNQAPVGLIELFVLPELRRQGLARYLLAQALRHLRDQPFHLFEAQSPLDDPAGVGLLRSLDFQEVEIGRGYEKTA
jgi:ribosomal protein S18 acetylase RimI-like enzyme